MDDNGEKRILQGKKKLTPVTMITSMQAKHSHRKGCVLFVVHISSEKVNNVEDAEIFKRYPILQQFYDVFYIEALEFLPHMEMEYSIELVLGPTPTAKTPSRMSTPELVELNFHWKEMIEKGYTRPSVSP